MATKKVNIDIIARDKSKQALKGVRGSLDNVKKSIFNVRNAFIGLGTGLAIRSLVKTGTEIEGLQVRLKFLFGTAEEGSKAFDKMAKFASKVPFSLAEIQQGAGVLAVVSKDADELAKVMELTGNVAAVTGLDFKTTAEQIQRSLSAGISAADLFRDRGVKAMLGFKAGATVSVEETAEAFERVFGKGGKFDGATDELAKTFEGTLSMIGDKIFNFKRVILEKGFFPELKKQFKDLDNFLKNESLLLDEIATKIGQGLAIALRSVSNAFKFVKENADLFILSMQGLIALKVATVFYGMTTALAKLTLGMKAFNFATKKNIIFGSLVVFAGALGFVIHKFKEFKGELVETTRTVADLQKEIAELEKRKFIGRGASEKIQKHKIQMALLKNELNLLLEEQNKLNIENTNHIRSTNKITEKYVDATKAVKDYTDSLVAMQIEQGIKKDQQVGMSEHDQKALEDKKAHEEEINRILQENRQKGINIFYEMQQEKERINNEAKVKEINDEVAHFNRLKEVHEQYGNSRLEGEKLFEDKKAELKKQAIEESLTSARGALKALSGINENAFKAFKAVQIAEATINAFKAASNAFKTYPFPFNIVAAGAALAQGMAMVAQIRSVNYSKREQGGPVIAGKSYMVGEGGAEMFTPSTNGNIESNNSKPINVNFNINTVDARGFNELLVNSRGVIINMLNSAVNEKGRAAII